MVPLQNLGMLYRSTTLTELTHRSPVLLLAGLTARPPLRPVVVQAGKRHELVELRGAVGARRGEAGQAVEGRRPRIALAQEVLRQPEERLHRRRDGRVLVLRTTREEINEGASAFWPASKASLVIWND